MLEYDPYDYKFHDDPYPVYRALRDHAPAYHNEKYNFWALSRYHDCQHAVRDFKTFSSAQGTSLEELKAQLPTLINSDPPIHTRVRHLVSGLFTPEKLAPRAIWMRDMARELLAPNIGTRRMYIIGYLAAKRPMSIICKFLGFPPADK